MKHQKTEGICAMAENMREEGGWVFGVQTPSVAVAG